jgi:hypothetical protein
MTTPCGAWSPYTKKLASHLLKNSRSSILFLCYIKLTESNCPFPSMREPTTAVQYHSVAYTDWSHSLVRWWESQ